jgi:hypothetical protein
MPLDLPPGTHELVWVYEKDFAGSTGADAAWIDNLVIPNVEFGGPAIINGATGPDSATQPWAVPNLPGTNYVIRLERHDVAPWLAFDTSDSPFAIQPPAAPPPPPQPTPPAPPPPPPPPPRRCVVPNVKGKTVAQARPLLVARRCALGRVTRAYSARIRKSRIISQSRRPGVRLPVRTKVNVVVSRGRRR